MRDDLPPPAKSWHLLGRGKLPITSTLLVGFAGLVGVAVATVLAISIIAARQTTRELQAQAAQQRLDAAISRIETYLAPAAGDVSFLAGQLSRSGGIPLDDDSRISPLMRGSLGSAPQIDGLAQGNGAAGAALVEDDDAVMGRIEESPMGRARPRSRSAMEEDHWHALRIAALLPIHLVPTVEIEHAAVERLDLGIKRTTVHEIPPRDRRAPL